jgi:membrane protease subunit (stomatin/prohibitin family)
LTSGERIQTILYAADRVIKVEYEDKLQMTVNKLNKTAIMYDMKIFSSKTKTTGLGGKNI